MQKGHDHEGAVVVEFDTEWRGKRGSEGRNNIDSYHEYQEGETEAGGVRDWAGAM